jgi:cbb3-type cytochrome oxidase maturation protein
MSVLFIMLPAALVLAGLALLGFIVSVRRGQLDDLDTPPIRAVFDDEGTAQPTPAAARPAGRTPTA